MTFGFLLIVVISLLPNGLVSGVRDLYLYLKNLASSRWRQGRAFR